MKNLTQLFLSLSILATIFLAACSVESNEPAKTPLLPQTNDTYSCEIKIATGSNGSLACGKTLSEEHQTEIVKLVMENHGISCEEEGDTIRVSNVDLKWEPDFEGGWNIISAKGTCQYKGRNSLQNNLNESVSGKVETIFTNASYCPLGTSCLHPEGCAVSICPLEECSARVTTGGVIIAVVSGIFGGGEE